MAAGTDCCSGCVGHLDAAVQRGAWPAITAGIFCLMLASMGVWPVPMSVAAGVLILQANMLLILFSTRRRGDAHYDQLKEEGQEDQRPPRLNIHVCLQAYGMLPISGIAVLSLALHRAEMDADVLREGRVNLTDVTIPAVSFLEFMDCKSLLRPPRNASTVDERFAVQLHIEFMDAVMYALVALLVILGVRALFADILPQKDENEVLRVKRGFSALRGAHSAATGLLIFAVVGYFPMTLSCIACGVSVLASLAGLILLECCVSEQSWKQKPAGTRQVYAFFNVTLPCVYSVGCLLLEQKVMDPQQRTAIVHLRYVAFQLAFCAAVWFLLIVAIRSCVPHAKLLHAPVSTARTSRTRVSLTSGSPSRTSSSPLRGKP